MGEQFNKGADLAPLLKQGSGGRYLEILQADRQESDR
jgi:hypothetical protein